MYSSTLSLTSALDGGGWLTPRPGRFIPGKRTRYPFYRRPGEAQGRSGRVRKISPPPVLSLSLYWICSLSLLCLLSFTVQHKHPYPRRDSNPQPQQASGYRSTPQTARPLGSAIRSLDLPVCSEALYRLSCSGPLNKDRVGMVFSLSRYSMFCCEAFCIIAADFGHASRGLPRVCCFFN